MLKYDSKCCIIVGMKTKSSVAIRITATEEVRKALVIARKRYSTLSDAEIFKVGLSKVVAESKDLSDDDELEEIRLIAANSFGYSYPNDPEEDIYHEGMGKKVNFK